MLIGFGHSSRVGKDSCCEFIRNSDLVRRFRLGGCSRVSFASALKQTCHDLFHPYGLHTGRWYETEHGAPLRDVKLTYVDKTPVEIWIEVGQKMRAIYPSIWVDLALAKVIDHHLTLISDVRFPNEMEAIKARGGWCVLVRRPGNPVKGSDRFLSEDSDWDAVIENDGDLEHLQAVAIDVAERYLNAR